jgi:hypothetical protein
LDTSWGETWLGVELDSLGRVVVSGVQRAGGRAGQVPPDCRRAVGDLAGLGRAGFVGGEFGWRSLRFITPMGAGIGRRSSRS